MEHIWFRVQDFLEVSQMPAKRSSPARRHKPCAFLTDDGGGEPKAVSGGRPAHFLELFQSMDPGPSSGKRGVREETQDLG